MSLILSIETSTKLCSVALQRGESILAAAEISVERSHSKYITVLIESLFKFAGEYPEALDAVAVSKGPGSYTGLRIGASTAKGLCYALDKPLIAINTLASMAHDASRYIPQDAHLCPMLDARRMEVYCALFDAQMNELLPVQAKIIDAFSFSEELSNKQLFFFGDGAQKCMPFLEKNNNAVYIDKLFPSAKSIGALAQQAFKKNTFEDVAYFEPYYLKDFFRFGN